MKKIESPDSVYPSNPYTWEELAYIQRGAYEFTLRRSPNNEIILDWGATGAGEGGEWYLVAPEEITGGYETFLTAYCDEMMDV